MGEGGGIEGGRERKENCTHRERVGDFFLSLLYQ